MDDLGLPPPPKKKKAQYTLFVQEEHARVVLVPCCEFMHTYSCHVFGVDWKGFG